MKTQIALLVLWFSDIIGNQNVQKAYPMDKLAKIFDNGKKINVIKDVAVQTIGAEETQRAWAQARGILAELLAKYPQLTPKEEEHTDLIFSHIAVYRALMAAHPDVAMKIMEQGEAVTAKQTGATFQKVVRLPLARRSSSRPLPRAARAGSGPRRALPTRSTPQPPWSTGWI
ncbi:hypothetical protein [Paratractidigestivibacter sp.]|uniref:hypothetical protein n=1 Tax=Paratractidigestivibacter sp. TaxID=2847316 RepID=UPI002AC92445|nr:hypothetical protein [Paratractidigestivibacter sp.]